MQKDFFLWVSGVQTMDTQAEREIRGLVHRLDLLMVLHLCAVEGKPRTGSCKSFACRNLWDRVSGSVLCRSPKKLYFREAILIINFANNKPYLC